jgi:hypothetical protein
MEILKDKKILVGGLAIVGALALLAYLKPKPRLNSEGFFNAVGKGIPDRVPIASNPNDILALKAEIKMSINKLISYCGNPNANPTFIFDKLNLIRLKIEEFHLKILFLELDESGNVDFLIYLLLGVDIHINYFTPNQNFSGGLYGQLKLINDVKRGASVFQRQQVLQSLNVIKQLFDSASSTIN